MRSRLLALSILVAPFAGCGDSAPKHASDMLHRVTFTLGKDSCRYEWLAMPENGWLSTLDVYERFDGTFDLYPSPEMPTPLEVFGQVVVSDDGHVNQEVVPPVNTGLTEVQKVVGYIDGDSVDLTFTTVAQNDQGRCEIEFTLKGEPRDLRSTRALDGRYHIKAAASGIVCEDGRTVPPESASSFLMPTDILPIGKDGQLRITLGGAWFEAMPSEIASEDGWHGNLVFPGEPPVNATVHGAVSVADTTLTVDFDATEASIGGPGCVSRFEMSGSKQLYDPATFENDYRAYAVIRPCGGQETETAELPISIVSAIDGVDDLYILQEGRNQVFLSRDASGVLSFRFGSVDILGQEIAYTVTSERPLTYQIVEKRLDSNSQLCQNVIDVSAAVRFNPDEKIVVTSQALRLTGMDTPSSTTAWPRPDLWFETSPLRTMNLFETEGGKSGPGMILTSRYRQAANFKRAARIRQVQP